MLVMSGRVYPASLRMFCAVLLKSAFSLTFCVLILFQNSSSLVCFRFFAHTKVYPMFQRRGGGQEKGAVFCALKKKKKKKKKKKSSKSTVYSIVVSHLCKKKIGRVEGLLFRGIKCKGESHF